MLAVTVEATEFMRLSAEVAVGMPRSAPIYYSLKFAAEKYGPKIEYRAISYPADNPVCFAMERNDFPMKGSAFLLYFQDAHADAELLADFMKQLASLRPEGFHLWLLPQCQLEATKLALSASFDITPCYPAVFAYWIRTEKHASLLSLPIEAPAGFHFDSLRPDEAELVSAQWPHRTADDEPYTRAKLQHLPSACLRVNGSGELAAFEMLDPSGLMNHLFTFPPFRRNNLATLVELKLAQQLLRMGVTPFKYVVTTNDVGNVLARKSEWWTEYICCTAGVPKGACCNSIVGVSAVPK